MIKKTKMIVELASVGNPDFGQDPDRPMYGCDPDMWVPVMSYKEASKLCTDFIRDNDLGGGNWSGGDILVEGKLVGYVSYNGRVWEVNEESPKWNNDAKEILIRK